MSAFDGVDLTDSERAELLYLSGRRKTLQGLAGRARLVLACAEGGSPAMAARLGVHADTVRKWWHCSAEDRLEGLRDSPIGRSPPNRGRQDRGGDCPHLGEPTFGQHALEFVWHSACQRLVRVHRAACVAGIRLAAASVRKVQAVYRPRFCGQGRRCRRPLHGAARAGAGAVRERKSQIQALDHSQPMPRCVQAP